MSNTVIFRKYKKREKSQFMHIDKNEHKIYIFSKHLPKDLKKMPVKIKAFQRLKGTENKFLVTEVEPVYSTIKIYTTPTHFKIVVTGFHETIQHTYTKEELQWGKKKEKITSILMYLAKTETSLGYQNNIRKLAFLKIINFQILNYVKS